MPIRLDIYPHPQLRYIVRLEYIHPVSEKVEAVYIYMTDEEFEKSYLDIIERKKEEIREELGYNYGWEYEITEWGYCYAQNAFTMNEILSDNVINLLKTGEVSYPCHNDEEERELALAYLREVKPLYTKEQVAQAILSVIEVKPNVEIVNRILKEWGASINRDTYVEMQLKTIVNSNDMDLALGKLLKTNNDYNLKLLKVALKHLSVDWNLTQEEDAHRRAILVYRFLTECPLLQRNKMSLKKGLETLSTFLVISISPYTKEVYLTPYYEKRDKNDNIIPLTTVENRKKRIYSQINSQWATFKARHLK